MQQKGFDRHGRDASKEPVTRKDEKDARLDSSSWNGARAPSTAKVNDLAHHGAGKFSKASRRVSPIIFLSS